ncbi:MAG: VCBS repeat-containing protein, partial [Bacteroidales bacterium]|nr:VCBS repeat-containing protein [Bacteroidales bacterium]
MKKSLTLLFLLCSIALISQPVQETILTDNFTDPYTLKTEDMDNNTHPDIIACGVGGIVWFSNEDGTNFTKNVLLDSLSVVSDIEVLDYNADTHLDIIGINTSTGKIFWLENDGSMNFTHHLITDTIVDLRKMSAADMDNDGDIDIMFSVYSGGFYDIYLYENIGLGFTSTKVDRVDFNDIYIFDYNNDGYIDFLTKTNYSPFTTEELAIMINDGSNTFIETQIYEKSGSIDITDAYFVDLTGNGVGDLIIADNVQNTLFWLWNSISPRTILASADPTNVMVGDFNNDGIYDIVYKDEDSGDNDFKVLQGANPGTSMTFSQEYVFDLDATSSGLICLDVNSDNLPEFAYTSAARDEVAYFKNNDSFSFTLKKLSTNVSQPESLNLVDLDQDGDLDIVCITSNEEMSWFDQQADGTYKQVIITSDLNNPIEVKVNDVDDDGDLDIISASTGDADFSIWYNDGNENFTEFQLTSTSSQISNPSFFEITDLDNDGDKDFVIVGSSISSTYPKGVFWIRNEGGGVYSSPIAIKTNVNLMGQVAVYDFDGDGNKDIIVSNDEYGSTGLFIFKNNASASFFTLVSTFTSFRAVRVELGDIDGDGLMDFVTRNDDDNDLVWFKGNGDLTFTPNTITMSEFRDVKFALVDDNNDGDTDIFFYTFYYGFTNGAEFNAGILNNDGNENFTQTYFLENVNNMLSAIPLDIDYDSDIDFFVGMDVQDKISFYENMAIDLIDPTVSAWPTTTAIIYGDALSSSVLSGGTASVPGIFEFQTPSMTPNAGIYSATVKFIPDDAATYSVVLGNVDVTVHKADPVITTWPAASDIEYSQALSTSVLSGGVASVSGTFTFDNPTTTPSLGVYTADVTFTPDNVSNYNTASGTVDVNVIQANPTINSWPTASDITYGEALSASILTGGAASVPGTFTFDNPTTIPNA